MTPVEIAYAFVEAINAHDPNGLARWMTDDHVFVDSDGSEQTGRERMLDGWRAYFAMVPDYRIEVETACAKGETVVLTGRAEGTFEESGVVEEENHWRVPAAWRVVVADGRVRVWQLYVNPEPILEVLARIRAREESRRGNR